MKRKFMSLDELEEMGYTILDQKDVPVIQDHLDQEIELFVTDDLRIESEAGKYLADVSFESPY